MMQSVFFMYELFTTTATSDNGSAVYSSCVTDQIGIILKFLLAVLTNVFAATKQIQSN
jgi:hypothetical protein